jgi:hypothetical protein
LTIEPLALPGHNAPAAWLQPAAAAASLQQQLPMTYTTILSPSTLNVTLQQQLLLLLPTSVHPGQRQVEMG